MAGKECIMVLLDVGASMHEKYSQYEDKTRLEVGAECLKLLIQQKMLFQKSHEVGLILFGSDDADAGDAFLARGIEKTDLNFARYTDEILEAEKSKLKGGDIFAALETGLDALDDYVKKRKPLKKAFVITNGAGATSYSKDKVVKLARKTTNLNTKVNFITIDFCEDDEADADEDQTPEQNKNQALLHEFVRNCEARIFPSNVALSIYKQFRSRSVYPVAQYKGTFDIGPTLKIQVLGYGKTKEERFPSLKKHSLLAKQSKAAASGKVKLNRESYYYDDEQKKKGDSDMKMVIVEKEKAIRGFNYGKQLVPVDENLMEGLKKYKAEKCMKLLGFADSKSVPRHYFLNGVDMIIPVQDESLPDTIEHKKAFAALVHAMFELDKVAIVRFVKRDNNPPKLAVLSPHIAKTYECLWCNILPTVEDLRDYQFNSLKEANTQQMKVMGDFIDSLDLMACEDDEGETFEALKINETFNPVLQYFYQCLLYRAFNEDNQLPMLDPLIAGYVRPDKKVFDKAQLYVSNMIKSFPLVEKDITDNKTPKVYWRDIIQQETENVQNKMAEEVKVSERVGDKDKPITFEEEERVRNIGTSNPISDFKKMLGDKSEDLASKAIEQMTEIIRKFITESFQGSLYEKALQCLIELRKACIDEDEAPAFNQFLSELKDKYSKGKFGPFWDKVVNDAVTLISKDENKTSNASLEEARKFLLAQDEKVQSKTDDMKKQEEKDLMADIE
eukprot:CAMPEP_0176474710 /NCGR_PEP_ID=MMETSP0127-20121128/43185_1 /TAXON_ID=938130 /ORGANISM="Platyophrya macrostoma, Strain WH" /LENGTH=729 /DNA_ID=CAMNT_0017870191 /DNA_START=31 /DNA_END=2220 /DNA_ORIENTATION=+